MTKNGTADAVKNILDEMGFLKIALQNDLINYSALARFIKPLVEEKTGGKDASVDAIIMAIRRHVKTVTPSESHSALLRIMGDSKLVLRTGMALLHFRRSSELYWRLVEIEKTKVNWHTGDKMNIIQRSDEITVIASHKLLPLIRQTATGDELLAEWSNLALMTVDYPTDANLTPGTLSFIAGQLENINVNIVAVYNTLTKVSFVINEQDAAKSYDRLSSSFLECRQAAEKMPGTQQPEAEPARRKYAARK